ncbi:putative uncharacterized protein [Firmicutes bacterium CAG:534]|nr:putative uncharacterized protein [Firmicutes bacterium CAG:534]
MSKIYRGEMQDNLGNTIYPHTEAGLVYCSDGETVQEKLTGTAETLDGITGVSDSTELDDSTKLATSKAVNTLRSNVNSSLNGCSFEQEGNSFYIIGADAVRKRLGSVTLYIRATSSYVSDSNLSRKLVLEISTDNKTWKTVASNQFKADVSRSVAYTYSQ